MQRCDMRAPMRIDAFSPVSTPWEQCAWCWKYMHPDLPYPEHWSSTICAQHDLQLRTRRRQQRQRKRYLTLLEIYNALAAGSLSSPPPHNAPWLKAAAKLFKNERDLPSPLQAIHEIAREQGREDYLRYCKKMERQEPFSLVWERGRIAALRFFRHATILEDERAACSDEFIHWYCIGYVQLELNLFLHHNNISNYINVIA
ncbi:hypothetical protein [Dictyobacter kobayashii]|uniref:Uncharacterized protein n=1 Tax=Dictyobacter kobayashii TaxID=2014872 RepID=A0A402AYQ1_9CHLR|nr:hypothetical protein [Dictyobacter kobayashii]GCE24224.1 hypothetical protein KDK_80240 [Dictyobacter kobayashii]